MDNQDQKNNFDHPRHTGRILAGFFLLIVGTLFFMKEMAFPFFPNWLFTWPMILIAIGIYSGFKHEFRNAGWLIMIIIGVIFLLDDSNLGFDFHRFIVPMIIIAIGFVMIVRPRRSYRYHDWKRWREEKWGNWNAQQPGDNSGAGAQFQGSSSENYIDSTSIFGGTKKVILSKNFQGGDITCIFGGCEIDFTHADMQNPAVIDITFMFGGGKIIVPSNWQVRLEMTPVFGSVEDKRQQPINSNPDKILIIKGTCIFGGLEIKNY